MRCTPSRYGSCGRSTAAWPWSTGCRSTSRRARCSHCSARTAPARRRRSRSSRGTARRTGAPPPCSATTRGRRERAFRERIGIVLQEAGFEEDFTVVELLRLQRQMYARRLDADALVDLVGLGDKRKARVSTLSGGQRRRLDLALGLVGDPELVFLDEPTVGFDPEARRRAWAVIEELRQLGKTVLLTTHYLDEAQQLADRVAVMVAGRLAALGTPTELAAAERATVVTFRLSDGLAASACTRRGSPDHGGGRRLAARDRTPLGGAARRSPNGPRGTAGSWRPSRCGARRSRTPTSPSSARPRPTRPRPRRRTA